RRDRALCPGLVIRVPRGGQRGASSAVFRADRRPAVHGDDRAREGAGPGLPSVRGARATPDPARPQGARAVRRLRRRLRRAGRGEPRSDAARALYEQGVAAAERALGPDVFAQEAGRFWGIVGTPPYMRARLGP